MPIEASGIIPLGTVDLANFPSLALSIPDFEGEAILRIFANSTQSEIACFSATITNGATFSHPSAVGSTLGAFTVIALLASFATAAYGEAVPTMRLHYAHSLSVGVVFAVWQHIFFTGAMSMDWPSVLVAWWSNFAWAGGQIYSETMQKAIDSLLGNNWGNTTEVGAAGSGTNVDSVGGGYDISQIYKRAVGYGARPIGARPRHLRDMAASIYHQPEGILRRDLLQRSVEHSIGKRALANATTGYKWYGHPVGKGLPLPGNYSGFAGTLAEEGIRVSNAFMTGFLWFLICLVILVAAMIAFKWTLEGLAMLKWVKMERFKYFRKHWLGYSSLLALRICYIGFFMIMFLTMFQFTYSSDGGVKAVAAIVFIIFLFGLTGASAYAYLYKNALDRRQKTNGLQVERKRLLGKIPWFSVTKVTTNPATPAGELPSTPSVKPDPVPMKRGESYVGSIVDDQGYTHSIHDSEDYTTKFGWLAARFRRTRWWFFGAWLGYEFLRAIFYAGASGYPLAQVFGLLIIEVLAFAFIAWARPFEGRRLNILVVYCLGFSKVVSVALSAAFDNQFNLDRIITTVIGIVIIVVQGILTIITMIAILVGAISSYMSVSRNREDFRPRKWAGTREKYFNHLDKAVNDLPPDPTPVKVAEKGEPEVAKEPYFELKSVRRAPKVEDEDEEFATEMASYDPASHLALDTGVAPTPARTGSRAPSVRSETGTLVRGRVSRAASVHSTRSAGNQGLPFGARAHRPSWSTRDFENASGYQTPIDMNRTLSDDEPAVPAPRPASTKSSRRQNRESMPNSAVRPMTSTDRLSIGGDISTRDMIGKVPAPTGRPRASTHGSIRNNRNSVPTFGENSEAGRSSDWLSELSFKHAGDAGPQRGGKWPPLTPAQEQDEFKLTPKVTRDE